jgi:hypothetical protein
MDSSIGVFDCVTANFRQMFATLKEGDRTAALGRILPLINQAFRIIDGIPLAPGGRACVGAGRRAGEQLRPAPGRFACSRVFPCQCMPHVKEI